MLSRMHGRNTAQRWILESGVVGLRRPTITTAHYWPLRRAIKERVACTVPSTWSCSPVMPKHLWWVSSNSCLGRMPSKTSREIKDFIEPVSSKAWTLTPPREHEMRGWLAGNEACLKPTEKIRGWPSTQPSIEAPLWSLKNSHSPGQYDLLCSYSHTVLGCDPNHGIAGSGGRMGKSGQSVPSGCNCSNVFRYSRISDEHFAIYQMNST